MNDSPADNVTFDQALAELEQVVRDLEDGKTNLEESLARYERGVNLIKRCYAQLREAEQRILLLTGDDAEGRPILRPFQHAATGDSDADGSKVARKRPDGADTLFFDNQS